jgi:hypothetical protein
MYFKVTCKCAKAIRGNYFRVFLPSLVKCCKVIVLQNVSKIEKDHIHAYKKIYVCA